MKKRYVASSLVKSQSISSAKTMAALGVAMVVASFSAITASAKVVGVSFETATSILPQTGDINHSTRFLPFDQWAAQAPAEHKALNLFAGFVEPTRESKKAGVVKKIQDKHMLFVARSSFIINKSVDSVNLSQYINKSYLDELDKKSGFIHTQIDASKILNYQANEAANLAGYNSKSATWCKDRGQFICVESSYNLGKLSIGVKVINKIEGAEYTSALKVQSELRLVPGAELVQRMNLKGLSGLETPTAGAIENSTMYVNQFLRWGKSVVIVQQHPANQALSVATIYTIVAISDSFYNMEKKKPSLAGTLNGMGMTPRALLEGTSPLNQNDGSILSGLPNYTATMAESLSALMNK
jgi:hypothetical protein